MTLSSRISGQPEIPGPSIEKFEALDFDTAGFDHEAHVAVAWRYLRQYEALECIARYRDTLKRLTDSLGAPGKYHETMTWFYMLAIAERAGCEEPGDWHSFRDRNEDLFAKEPALIRRYYSESRLSSDEARRRFVLPDLGPEPPLTG